MDRSDFDSQQTTPGRPLRTPRQLQQALRADVSLWQVIFETSREGLVIIDTLGRVIDANKAFAAALGYSLEEMLELNVWDWDANFDRREILHIVDSTDLDGVTFETRHRCKNGRILDVELSNNSVYLDDEKLIFCVSRDITERKQQELRIREMASTDALTGLLNRRKFSSILQREILRAERYHTAIALIMFDVDHFKSINDTYGHDRGDEVLVKVAALVRDSLRAVDAVCRWGGEEFMVMLPETNAVQAKTVAECLRKELAALDIPGLDAGVTASFGVAHFTTGDSEDALIRHADQAMYEAKHSGRNCVRVRTRL